MNNINTWPEDMAVGWGTCQRNKLGRNCKPHWENRFWGNLYIITDCIQVSSNKCCLRYHHVWNLGFDQLLLSMKLSASNSLSLRCHNCSRTHLHFTLATHFHMVPWNFVNPHKYHIFETSNPSVYYLVSAHFFSSSPYVFKKFIVWGIS